jgi:antitoxin (DNA-binding transcriptional repressor) of toxin-antitoxin stability system
MTTTIDLALESPTLDELLRLTEQGNDVVLVKAGQPVAKLVSTAPLSPSSDSLPKRTPGLQPGAIVIVDPDWDAPLPDEFWLGEPS